MVHYPKIKNIYERDISGTKKLVEGRFLDDTVCFLSELEWICTEKIDGTNIGVVWDGYKISYQGRTENASIPAHLVNKLNELFSREISEELFEQRFGKTQVILFGEGYGNKIQAVGGQYRDDVSFILFDVYMPMNNTWLDRKSCESIANMFGIEIVPIMFEGTLKEAVTFVKTNPNSTIGIAKMEGLVCRPKIEIFDKNHDRVIVKVKYKDFADISKAES